MSERPYRVEIEIVTPGGHTRWSRLLGAFSDVGAAVDRAQDHEKPGRVVEVLPHPRIVWTES